MSTGKEWLNDPDLFKNRNIAAVGRVEIWSKALYILSGLSTAGKTVSCLFFANNAILSGKKVLYIDTEEKSIFDYPAPNLFKEISEANPETFEKFFFYERGFEEKRILEQIKKIQPSLLIIDSIYRPFAIKYPDEHPLKRAVMIREFLSKLRIIASELNIGIVVTAPVFYLKNSETGKEEELLMGGEGMKYIADSKIAIRAQRKGKKIDVSSQDRTYVVDEQISLPFRLDYGGHIVPLDHEEIVKAAESGAEKISANIMERNK